MSRPILRFKVYVRIKSGPKTPFFWCSIWRTLPEMRAHLGQLTEEIPPGFRKSSQEKAYAACYSWKHTIGQKLQPEMGVLCFAMAYTGATSIPHECAHAAFRYRERLENALRKRKYTENYREELFCSVVGEMSRQIVRRLVVYDARKGKVNALKAVLAA